METIVNDWKQMEVKVGGPEIAVLGIRLHLSNIGSSTHFNIMVILVLWCEKQTEGGLSHTPRMRRHNSYLT